MTALGSGGRSSVTALGSGGHSSVTAARSPSGTVGIRRCCRCSPSGIVPARRRGLLGAARQRLPYRGGWRQSAWCTWWQCKLYALPRGIARCWCAVGRVLQGYRPRPAIIVSSSCSCKDHRGCNPTMGVTSSLFIASHRRRLSRLARSQL